MIGIDTNVLVRVLIDDKNSQQQCENARALLLQHDKIFISTIVFIETAWVLQRIYKVKKDPLILLIERLLLQSKLILENRPLIEKALTLYRLENFDFSDALILSRNQEKKCHLYTFDKKLGKHSSAVYLNKKNLTQ